jgi:hypothetical protein
MGETLTLWRRTLAMLGGPARLALPTPARPWPDDDVPVPTDVECRARRALVLPMPGGPVVWMAAPVGDRHRGAVTLDYVPGRRTGQWRAIVHRYGGRLVRAGDSPFHVLVRAVYTVSDPWRPALRLGDLKHAAELAATVWHGDAPRAEPRIGSE